MTPNEQFVLEQELARARRELAWEATKTTADVAGLLDPSPISDGVSALMSVADGEWVDAGLSAASMIPYLGDFFAKPAKAARITKRAAALATQVKTIENALAGSEDVGSALRKLERTADGKICIPCVQLRLQSEAKPGHYIGVVKGKQQFYNLQGVQSRRIKYTKRNRAEYNRLRKDFNSKHRAAFLRDIGNNPGYREQLKKAGLSQKQIKAIQDGVIPDGWDVHHKLPLDDGGTNDFTNLVLIKRTPVHTTFTNAQSDLTKGLAEGQSRTIDFPVPDGVVYPPDPSWVMPIKP